MKVILSHQNIDFDGIASMIAAKKLYPDAILAISDKLDRSVTPYMAIYRDLFQFSSYQDVHWDTVTTLILVDVASISRTGIPTDELIDDVPIKIYDHHPPFTYQSNHRIEEVGATVTLLIEDLTNKNLSLTKDEVNLFGLGLYSDTGNFTFHSTTSRDFEAAAFLMKNGLDIEIVNRFVTPVLTEGEQQLFNTLFKSQTTHYLDGLHIIIASYEQDRFQNGLSSLTEKLLDTSSADGIIVIVKMGKHVHIVCRASSSRINFQSFIKNIGGGGHTQAASAMIKNATIEESVATVRKQLATIIEKAVLAEDIMSSPVKTIREDEKISDAKEAMIRFGHTGFPVLNEDSQLVGIISRRDVDKAMHHRYGHAPIKGYMTRDIITLPHTATMEEIQRDMMTHNIGRIPIMKGDKVVGIVSRSNIISHLQKNNLKDSKPDLIEKLKGTLDSEQYQLLSLIGKEADRFGVKAYLVGGFVRDLFLERPNEDVDVVIEGDGIGFAQTLATTHGGEVNPHETFGTATWTTENHLKIDIVTCRTEYYEESAALPTVKASNIHEDLTRRDFTINAMALSISEHSFGELLDDYQGLKDLKAKKIRILHPMSFVEDPTRIFRAVRFATRFGYNLDKETARLAKEAATPLGQLSQTRLLHEIFLIHEEAADLTPYKMLEDLNVWNTLFGHQPRKSSWKHVENLLTKPNVDVFEVILALCLPLSSWETLITSFITTAKSRSFVEGLKSFRALQLDSTNRLNDWHELLHGIKDDVLEFISLDPLYPHQATLQLYLKKRRELTPLLTGHDLIELGLKPGPSFRELLLSLESKQMEENLLTKNEAVNWVLEEINKIEASQ
ncbi:CBS domain-containing protein [Alkalihalophilus sp. As8PL]|uniref:CBS domain-containing protein n=1 Tax=Alkalihalophilus sp. As8PL TaxID=3237103 RepID=A0AB39BRR7_9BACI